MLRILNLILKRLFRSYQINNHWSVQLSNLVYMNSIFNIWIEDIIKDLSVKFVLYLIWKEGDLIESWSITINKDLFVLSVCSGSLDISTFYDLLTSTFGKKLSLHRSYTLLIQYPFTDQILSFNSSQKCALKFFFGNHPIQSKFYTL